MTWAGMSSRRRLGFPRLDSPLAEGAGEVVPTMSPLGPLVSGPLWM